MSVTSICGVILVTENVDALARFYSEGLGLKLEREDHGGLDPHYGVDLGQLHFAIHPPSNFGNRGESAGTAVAFAVTSLDEHLERVLERRAEVIREPHDEGFGRMVTLADPEGNLFELIELRYEFAGS
jgi:predicted enzyme related to lactoylglutathione lyase